MSEDALMCQTELRKEVIRDGVKLRVVARRVEEDEWELSVENERGQRSVWIEPFITARMALDAGIKAIESEGVGSFANSEGVAIPLED